jgi:hypothetical protein
MKLLRAQEETDSATGAPTVIAATAHPSTLSNAQPLPPHGSRRLTKRRSQLCESSSWARLLSPQALYLYGYLPTLCLHFIYTLVQMTQYISGACHRHLYATQVEAFGSLAAKPSQKGVPAMPWTIK